MFCIFQVDVPVIVAIKRNANSNFVSGRIKNYYNREADIIYPPVDTSLFQLSDKDGDYFLIVSALVPYKMVHLAIDAFNILSASLTTSTSAFPSILSKIT